MSPQPRRTPTLADAPAGTSGTSAAGTGSNAGAGAEGGTQRDSSPPKGTASASRSPRGSKKVITEGMTDIYTSMGMALEFAGQKADAAQFYEAAPKLGEAWAELAEKNPAVKRVLLGFIDTGAWSSLIFAHAGLIIPIARNHNIIPEGFPFGGIVQTPAADTPAG